MIDLYIEYSVTYDPRAGHHSYYIITRLLCRVEKNPEWIHRVGSNLWVYLIINM